MESQLKVTFFLYHQKLRTDNTTPIYMKISYSNEYVQISTGISVHSKTWNINTQKIKGNSPEVVSKNETLKLLELKVWSIINELLLKGKPFTVHTIKTYVKCGSSSNPTLQNIIDLYIERIEKLLRKEYSTSSLQKYNNTKLRINEFVSYKYNRKDIFIHEVDNSFIMDFIDYLKYQVGNQQRTIQKHYQRLFTMINYSVKKGIIEKIPFNNIKVKVPPMVVSYLTQEEVNRIESTEFNNERLNTIRDLFIFSVYSGFSYSEMRNLHESNIKYIENQVWVDMTRQKTKRQYRVPLLLKCEEIIQRYKNHRHRIEKGLLLPLPSNQKFNSYLKEVQTLCSINTKLTCHLGRRTFGSTILLMNNVSIHVISQLLGHSNTSITIKSYLGLVPELMLSEFSKIQSIYKMEKQTH